MTENPFDFDTNPNFLVSDYDIAVHQSIPGCDALLTMVNAPFQTHLNDDIQTLVVVAGGGNEISVLGQAHRSWRLTTKLDYLRAIAARLKSGSPFVLVDSQGDKHSELFQRLFKEWQKRSQLAGMEPQRLTELVNKTWQQLQYIPEERTLELLDQTG